MHDLNDREMSAVYVTHTCGDPSYKDVKKRNIVRQQDHLGQQLFRRHQDEKNAAVNWYACYLQKYGMTKAQIEVKMQLLVKCVCFPTHCCRSTDNKER